MSRKPKKSAFNKLEAGLYILIFLVIAGFGGILPVFELKIQEVEADLEKTGLKITTEELEEKLPLLQENSLLAISSPANPEPEAMRQFRVVITGYSSSPWETDDTPNLTAAGTGVREGIIANNLLPFGTKVRIPELYGDKIFVVEDRMNWEKSDYHIDIWFPSYWEALNFGAKRTYIEILEG